MFTVIRNDDMPRESTQKNLAHFHEQGFLFSVVMLNLFQHQFYNIADSETSSE